MSNTLSPDLCFNHKIAEKSSDFICDFGWSPLFQQIDANARPKK
jgi:hypothetical protein